MLIALALMWDMNLGRMDGLIMLISMFVIVGLIVKLAGRPGAADPLADEFEQELPEKMTTLKTVLLIVFGLAMMLGGSKLLVNGAVGIAIAFGVSELVIGLTIVAVGTSLPELAASIMSAIKGEPDIALGNVIGSNMFNILIVMCVPGLISPNSFSAEVITRDFSVMFGLSILMLITAYGFRGPGRITRLEGTLLLLVFVGYQFMLFYHGAEPAV
jgi:cation:H+ antiporter